MNLLLKYQRRKQKHSGSIAAREGFTLIEFLVYSGIIGVMFILGLGIALNVLFVKTKAHSIELVGQNARFALGIMSSAVRNAQTITIPAFGDTASVLTLQTFAATTSPIVFFISSGTLFMTEGGGAPVALTVQDVQVTSLIFSNVTRANSHPPAVRFQLNINARESSARPEFGYAQTFFTTAVIREE